MCYNPRLHKHLGKFPLFKVDSEASAQLSWKGCKPIENTVVALRPDRVKSYDDQRVVSFLQVEKATGDKEDF